MSDVEARLHLHAWQLRQILPADAAVSATRLPRTEAFCRTPSGQSRSFRRGTSLAVSRAVDSWVTGIVESMGYFGVALLMALENVFPPIPSEVIMPLAGYIASQGELQLWLAIAVGTVATLVGTLPWYGAARWLDSERVYAWVDRHGHWLAVRRDELERAERWFGDHGRWVVAVGRLVPGIRTLISIPAGFCEMPLGRYLAYSALGTAIWTGGLAYLGNLLGKSHDQIGRYIGPVTWVVLGAMLLTYLVRLVRMRRDNHAQRTAADSRA